ncbi:MAG: cellulase family glycosylhydrolase [Acidimicrobiales bacterium]
MVVGLGLPALAMVIAPSAQAVGAVDRAPLATNGGRIVDRNGATFVVQGVNWFGFETQNHVPHGLWTRDYKDMLVQIKSLGFNTIRLPFSIQALQSQTTSGITFASGKNAALNGKTPLQAMDVIIQEAAAQGLLIMLDNHSLADDGFSYDLWYDGAYSEDAWVANWEMLAQRYKNQPNVIAADLKNEPHGRATWGDGSATDWRRAATRAGNAVLVIAPQWLIVVEGTEGPVPGQQLPSHWWGGNLEAVDTHPVVLNTANRIVYSPHEYGPGVYNQPWFSDPNYQTVLYDRWAKGFQYIADQGLAPVWVGEFGGRQTGTDTVEGAWQRQFMDFLGKKGDAWTYWSWNPNSGDTGGILNDDWTTVNMAKMDLLSKLIRREAIDFPGSGNPTTTTTTPPTTTTPTTVPPSTTTTTRPPSGAGLTGQFVTDSTWESGYCGRLVASNSTGASVSGLSFTFSLPASHPITSSWNGTFTRSASTATVSLPPWAQTLAAGASYDQTGFCVQGLTRPSNIQARANGVVSPTTTTAVPATTTTTRPPAPSTTTTTAPVTGGLSGTALLDSSWETGYCSTIEMRNGGSTTVTPRTVRFSLDTGVGFTDSWNGTIARSGTAVTVTLPSWVAPLAPGQSAKTFGFCTNTAATSPYLPTGVTVI